MSRRVLFNGAVLIRPGAATKLDASQFQNIALSGIGVVGFIGEADSGEPRTLQAFSSSDGVKAFYEAGDLVEAAAMAALPSNDTRITSGASAIICYKVNNSTQASLTASALALKTKRYGVLANTTTVSLATSGSGRILTASALDLYGNVVDEVSPVLGGSGVMTMQYVGAAASATVTITATTLSTTCAATPLDDLSITFSDFRSLNDMITYINNHANYTAAALIGNAASFDPSNLDALTAQDVKTSLLSLKASNFEIYDWITKNSSILTATLTKGQVGPPTAIPTATPMTGGTRGTSDNTAWVNGFTALRSAHINQLVPLASANATATQGSFTIAAISAAFAAHLKYVSSTAGRNEAQGWYGVNMTKTNLIAEALLRNSEHMILLGQKPTIGRSYDGAPTVFSEWAMAATLAGLRAGAPLGEPLTWKYPNILGVTQDASWSEQTDDDVKELTLNGVTVVCNIRNKGFRIDKCVTTFTRFDNDAFTEETIVQIWKNLSYELRTTLEDTYTGRPASLPVINTVPNTVVKVCERFEDAGAITKSNINGTIIPAYRNISYKLDGDKLYVSVTVSPTPGINYVLNTIVLVPASFAAAA